MRLKYSGIFTWLEKRKEAILNNEDVLEGFLSSYVRSVYVRCRQGGSIERPLSLPFLPVILLNKIWVQGDLRLLHSYINKMFFFVTELISNFLCESFL